LILIQEGFERGSPLAFQRRSAILTRLTVGRGRIEGGVQAQSGDEGDRLAQGLAAVEQVEDGVAAVPHSTRGLRGSQRRSSMIICRVQSAIFLWRRPCRWW